MVTLEQVIDAIRDKHMAFSDLDHPDGTLARFLSDYQRRLISKALELNQYFLVQSKTLYLPFAIFDRGETFPAFDHVLGATVVLADLTGIPALVATFEERFTPRRWPAIYFEASNPPRVFLMGRESDWTVEADLVVKYTPVVSDLVALGDTFAVPEKAKGALVSAGAFFLARRAGLAAELLAPFAGDARDEENSFLVSVGHMTRTVAA